MSDNVLLTNLRISRDLKFYAVVIFNQFHLFYKCVHTYFFLFPRTSKILFISFKLLFFILIKLNRLSRNFFRRSKKTLFLVQFREITEITFYIKENIVYTQYVCKNYTHLNIYSAHLFNHRNVV